MSRVRLSDIFSPLQSDISLNEASASATSLGDTPKTSKSSELTRNRFGEVEKDLGFSSCYKNLVEKDATAGQIMNDPKKQSNINTAKDLEKPCDLLTQSMDEVFHYQPAVSSVISPLRKQSKNSSNSLSDDSNLKDMDNKAIDKAPILQAAKSFVSILPDQKIKYSSKSSKITKVTDKVTSQQPKRAHSSKESIKKNEAISNKLDSDGLSIKTYNSKMKSASTQTCKSLTMFDSDPVKNRRNKNDARIKNPEGTVDSTPFAENEGILLDKRSQTFISMECDNIRNLMWDHTVFLNKNLLTLQEMVQKQNEVIEYLFYAHAEVVETNRKLMSKLEKS